MSRLAVMQPYLFPYIGYFQLLDAVDEFVVYDDVQFMKGGWIHRNRILVNGSPSYLTLPLHKDSTYLSICERRFAEPFEEHREKMLRQLSNAYRKAPFFDQTQELVAGCLSGTTDTNVARFVEKTLAILCDHLRIEVRFLRSSEMAVGTDEDGENRVLQLIRNRKADTYVNLPGGRKLYDPDTFAAEGIDLRFIEMEEVRYDQRTGEFVPNLSLIDVLMFNGLSGARDLLTRYEARA